MQLCSVVGVVIMALGPLLGRAAAVELKKEFDLADMIITGELSPLGADGHAVEGCGFRVESGLVLRGTAPPPFSVYTLRAEYCDLTGAYILFLGPPDSRGARMLSQFVHLVGRPAGTVASEGRERLGVAEILLTPGVGVAVGHEMWRRYLIQISDVSGLLDEQEILRLLSSIYESGEPIVRRHLCFALANLGMCVKCARRLESAEVSRATTSASYLWSLDEARFETSVERELRSLQGSIAELQRRWGPLAEAALMRRSCHTDERVRVAARKLLVQLNPSIDFSYCVRCE